MNKDFSFKASEVTCNGNIGGCATVLTDSNMAKLKTFINTHFMMVDKETILQELEDSNLIDGRWIIGSRASSTEEIIYRMVSGMMSYGLRKFAQNGGTYKAHRELSEMWINAQVNMMSAKDIITIMEKALVDCAEADHWYTYEKEWE
jgi:hypothetical protein